MIYLGGDTCSKNELVIYKRFSIGRLFVKNAPNPYHDDEVWGIDNGAYSDHLNNRPFNWSRWHRRVDKAAALGSCYMAVIPDRVGSAPETLDLAAEWLDGDHPDLPWYLVLQDGMTPGDLMPFWSRIDGLFLGGTDRLKKSAAEWCKVAHAKGKRFHYGRASTPRKLGHALRCHADSADSGRLPFMPPKEYCAMLNLLHSPEIAFQMGSLFE